MSTVCEPGINTIQSSLIKVKSHIIKIPYINHTCVTCILLSPHLNQFNHPLRKVVYHTFIIDCINIYKISAFFKNK